MFGMMEALLSFLRRQVGLRNDTANADGSLHAKVADLKSVTNNNIFPWHQKTATYSYGGIGAVAQSTIQEVLRINGDRVVLDGQIVGHLNADFMILELYVDEVSIFREITSVLSGTSGRLAPYRTVTTDGLGVQWVIPIPQGLHFSTSLVVRLEHTHLGVDNSTDVGVAVWHVPA